MAATFSTTTIANCFEFFEMLWAYCANLLNSLPQIKAFMVLTWSNINPELLINLVANNLSMWSEAHLQDTCHLHLEGFLNFPKYN